MARTLQKLIHFHGSTKSALDTAFAAKQTDLGVGEIAVVNGTGASDSYLAISNGANTSLIYFITSGAVDSVISTLSGAVEQNNTAFDSKISALSGEVETLSGSVVSLNNSAKGAIMDVDASGATGEVSGNYIQVATADTASGDFAKEKAIGVKIDVAESLGEIASDTKQLANAYAAQTYVKSVSGNIESSINTSVQQLEGKIDNAILSGKSYTDAQISGITSGIIEDIKNSLSDVYTYKGSVENYSDLTAMLESEGGYTGKSGDVYNVVNAQGTPGQSGYVPAGTNYAYVPANSEVSPAVEAHWDALGGTVDLSIYYTSGQVETKLEQAINTAVASAKSYTDSAITDLNIDQYAVSSITHTEIENAKDAAITAASGYTDQQVAALSGIVREAYWTSATTSEKLDQMSGAVNGKLNDVSGFSKNVYVELVNESHTSGSTESEVVDRFTVEAMVEEITAVTATGKLADAKDVKDYVDSAKNAGVTSAYTEASGLVHTEEARATGVEEGLQSAIDALKSGATVVSAVTAVTFTDLAAGTGVEGGTNANRNESGVAAKVENNTLKLDFDNLVIDCGSFDS